MTNQNGIKFITNMTGKALNKMMDHVPHLTEYFINMMEKSDTKLEFIEKCRETGYGVLIQDQWCWVYHSMIAIPENEVRVRVIATASDKYRQINNAVHADFILIFDTICFIRDKKISKILE